MTTKAKTPTPAGPEIERRTLAAAEVRMTGEAGGEPRVEGLAAPFNSLSKVLRTAKGKQFQEVILPGAFDGCLDQDTRCLINHDENRILGRRTAGTLRLRQEDRGLAFDCDLPDTSYARDLRAVMKRGDVSKCSFGFSVADDGQTFRTEGGMLIREIRKVSRLHDVSVVTNPAYDDTEVACRSIDEAAEVSGGERGEQRAMDACPACGAAVSPGAPNCPKCGAQAHAGYSLCGQCGGTLYGGQTFCETCGAKIPPQTVACPRCLARVTADAAFCPWCGEAFGGEDEGRMADAAARQRLAELV